MDPDQEVADVDGDPVSSVIGCDFKRESVENPERSEFYFESDHEALRGNPDYLEVLRTLAVLQGQRQKAVKDLEVLTEARDAALKDPLGFIAKLQAGEDIGAPGRQKVAKLTPIDWSKYGLASFSQMSADPVYRIGPSTRTGSSNKERIHQEHGALKEVAGLGCKVEKTERGHYLVRGRLFDGKTKPKTFNQPWTAEEQQRLEELLHEFPSEEVEMDRWKKIAERLGNRTPIQVQSRTQKYFVKLHKAGLPIPGRLGKAARMSCQKKNHGVTSTSKGAVNQFVGNRKMYANSLIGQRNSSFFPHLKPDIIMTEDDEQQADDSDKFWALNQAIGHSDPGTNEPENNGYYMELEDVSDEESVREENRDSEEYRELMWLKRIRREREWELREDVTLSQVTHYGYKCDGCDVDPIVGPRFTCVDCSKLGKDVDLCAECIPTRARSTLSVNHKEDHQWRPMRKTSLDPEGPDGAIDKDYVIKAKSESYLDPNYQYFK